MAQSAHAAAERIETSASATYVLTANSRSGIPEENACHRARDLFVGQFPVSHDDVTDVSARQIDNARFEVSVTGEYRL